eukprot:CAMPEP_0194394100 /NCGR_PEP_ID=MMETSP0174-20130528/123668_1 /TAXON_ID=216777 /ORGANISM="Proboscia alata, Strain PI-D3" /LENGTH=415 /DNA_ID=CAMNT_0039189861 /DNA_START=218 /DNA_END=1460 /DNA_ORIENTATION=-
MGQEDEEAAELVATIQQEHVPMKNWYATSQSTSAGEARSQYEAGGGYPSFWRDVLQWDGWRTVRKLYLRDLQTEGGGSGVGVGVVLPVETVDGVLPLDGVVPVVEEPTRGRKRRSRWATSDTPATAAAPPPAPGPPKRKSRWGQTSTPGPQPIPTPENAVALALAGTTSILDLLPGMPSNLTPTQMETLSSLQTRLRIANSRLENLENRRGDGSGDPDGATSDTPATAAAPPPAPGPPKRKSRWGQTTAPGAPQPIPTPENAVAQALAGTTSILDLLPGMPSNLTPTQMETLSTLQTRLRIANSRLENLELQAEAVDDLPRGHPDRSPSPPPIYGVDGKRRNTRAVRWRERYTTDRQDCLEQMMELNPSLRPPGFVKRRRHLKINIPVAEHPTYNFIGLIIGPRGKTQKEMENKT